MTVIGPIEHDVWITMRKLNSSIRYMKTSNQDGKWNDTLERETALYKGYKKDIAA
jgi:DUF438 domain-containing protein